MARRLRQISGDALISRLGGDEFGVLPPADKMSARTFAGLAVDGPSIPYHVEGQILRIGASVGLAFGTGSADEPDALMRESDEALYRAKAAGKGR